MKQKSRKSLMGKRLIMKKSRNRATCQGGSLDRPNESRSSYNHTRDADSLENNLENRVCQDEVFMPPIVYRMIQSNYGKPRQCIFCKNWTQNLAVFESYKTAKRGISETSTRYFFYGVCDCCSDKYSLSQVEQKLTEMCRAGEV